MLFSSLTFLLVFLPITLILYYISPQNMKNITLLILSLFFYAWGEPFYVVILILSATIDYFAGLLMQKFDDEIKKRKTIFVISLAINILLLGCFKYLSFFIANFNLLFDINISDPELPLPIGISLFTFQTMSYTIDIYRRKINVQHNFVKYLTFVTMFPQLVAGPIVRYSQIEGQLDKRTITTNGITDGINLFITGLAKKVLLANNIGLLWENVHEMPYTELSTLSAWLGIIAFAFQIYFDFSGYSDMAVGLGRMLGFELPINFNYPYRAKSVSDFWKRWHISMSGWFKEYIYIPLGGSRNSTLKTLRNLLIVWFITGFWHGAGWNFILWGLYFGIILICEKFFWGKWLERIPGFLKIGYTFILVLFGWIFFEAAKGDGSFTTTINDSISYFKAMFSFGKAFADVHAAYLISTYWVIFSLCLVGCTRIFIKLYDEIIIKVPLILKYIYPFIKITIFILCLIYLADEKYNPFLYYNF